MSGKSAVVVGATGVTGSELVAQLVAHPAYDRVTVLARRAPECDDRKLRVHIVDFDEPASWCERVRGDELFSALGTTLRQAGSKQAQYRVDFTYQAEVAQAAAANGVPRYFLVSSPGAAASSPMFYLRTKGQLDDLVRGLGFAHCVLIKPSLIVGPRADSRPAEKISQTALNALSPWLPGLRKYRAISGADLATAIINLAQSELPPGASEVVLDEIYGWLA